MSEHKKIHIGMDEAFRVGTGKYLQIHGIEDRFDIINNHLHKVCSIADKYNLEPMIWSDMFCKLALDIENQYESADVSKINEKAKLPDNVSLVYWDYYSTDYDRYVKQIRVNKTFGRKVLFAGGAWTWKGIAPDNDFSIRTTKAALDACRDEGVGDVFITVWGDDGNECPKATIFPSLIYAAQVYKGNDDMDSIKAEFKRITGCNFDDFMLFDKLDWVEGKYTECRLSKEFLYNDIFMGKRDGMCKPEFEEYYRKLGDDLSVIEEKGDYSYLFDCYKNLARVLEIKVNLGVKIREAYLNDNKSALSDLILKMDELVEKLELFHMSYETAWFKENKTHGFEVMDIRLGGLKQRIISCKRRLLKYINGEITTIAELEEPVLEKTTGKFWSRMVSAGRISFYL